MATFFECRYLAADFTIETTETHHYARWTFEGKPMVLIATLEDGRWPLIQECHRHITAQRNEDR